MGNDVTGLDGVYCELKTESEEQARKFVADAVQYDYCQISIRRFDGLYSITFSTKIESETPAPTDML